MDPIAAMDQTEAGLRHLAPVLSSYRIELLRTGAFTPAESFELVLAIQDRMTAPPCPAHFDMDDEVEDE